MGNSAISPRGVMRPMRFAAFWQNHRLPSPPAMMPIGVAVFDDSANSVKAALSGSKRPILAAPLSQNHSAPSGPSAAM